MLFSSLDTAIALAKKESAALVTIDARLQSFVAGYLIVDIVSEFEKRLEAIFALRVKKLGDVPIANFLASLLDRKFRSPDVTKINDALRKHDPSWLIAFEGKLAGTRWKTAMDSLIQNRHYYVHKSGTATMSLDDVVQAYSEAVKLFDALTHALGLSAADCEHLT